MSKDNYICVYDFETGSRNPYTTVPLELAAIMIDFRTLTLVPDSQFHTLIKQDWSLVQEEATKKNGITKEEMDKSGIDEKVAFQSFATYLRRYSATGRIWDAPMRGGHNICGFDDIIIQQLCFKYDKVDNDGRPQLFEPRFAFDTQHMCHQWLETLAEPGRYGLDILRDYFGISKEGAHRATKDVEDCARIICKFQQFKRTIVQTKKPKFKGCFAASPEKKS